MKKIVTTIISLFFVISIVNNISLVKTTKEMGPVKEIATDFRNDILDTESVKPVSNNLRPLMSHAVKILKTFNTIDMFGVTGRYGTSGSGVVIDVESMTNTSLVLTVYHVCEDSVQVSDFYRNELVTSVKNTVITEFGSKLKINEIIYADPSNDICVIEVTGIAGMIAYPAAFNPEKGDRIYSVGAPAGIWDVGIVNLVEGFFIGVKKEPLGRFQRFSQWSMPIVGGMSGSGVFHNGSIIGLVSHVSTEFNNVGWGPGLAQVRIATRTAIKKWRDRLYDD